MLGMRWHALPSRPSTLPAPQLLAGLLIVAELACSCLKRTDLETGTELELPLTSAGRRRVIGLAGAKWSHGGAGLRVESWTKAST